MVSGFSVAAGFTAQAMESGVPSWLKATLIQSSLDDLRRFLIFVTVCMEIV